MMEMKKRVASFVTQVSDFRVDSFIVLLLLPAIAATVAQRLHFVNIGSEVAYICIVWETSIAFYLYNKTGYELIGRLIGETIQKHTKENSIFMTFRPTAVQILNYSLCSSIVKRYEYFLISLLPMSVSR